MAKKNNCPLCRYKVSKQIESILINDLDRLYRHQLGLGIEELTKDPPPSKVSLYVCLNCGLKYFNSKVHHSVKLIEALEPKEWYFLDDKEEFHQAIENIKKTDRVLEIGAANGNFARKLKSKKYVGLEISSSARKIAENLGVRLLGETIYDYSIKNRGKFDVVCVFQTLEHEIQVKDFLEAAFKCLNKNGKFIVSVPNDDSFVGVAVNHELNFPPVHQTRWNIHVFEYIAKKYNLKIEKVYLERLRDLHIDWYLETLFINSVNSFLRRKTRLVDLSIKNKILEYASIFFAKVFAGGLFKHELRPVGESLTVVFSK
jgi:SAM-dependent methyltransferase